MTGVTLDTMNPWVATGVLLWAIVIAALFVLVFRATVALPWKVIGTLTVLVMGAVLRGCARVPAYVAAGSFPGGSAISLGVGGDVPRWIAPLSGLVLAVVVHWALLSRRHRRS